MAKIPKGRVSTYGEIARVLGLKDSRIVGWALKGNQDPRVPCHRIVKKEGFLAKNYSLGGRKNQKRKLILEGITFLTPYQVDLKKHFYSLEKK